MKDSKVVVVDSTNISVIAIKLDFSVNGVAIFVADFKNINLKIEISKNVRKLYFCINKEFQILILKLLYRFKTILFSI